MFLELKETLHKDKFTSTITNDGVREVIDGDDGDGDELVDDEVIHNAHQEIVNDQEIVNEQEIVQEMNQEMNQEQESEINQEQEQEQEIIQEPTLMSFSFLSTMNHIEPSLLSHSIEEITDEVNELDNNDETNNDDNDDNNDNDDNDETKIIKTDKYDQCTVKELKDILNDKKLPTSGNKSKLIQRIVENYE